MTTMYILRGHVWLLSLLLGPVILFEPLEKHMRLFYNHRILLIKVAFGFLLLNLLDPYEVIL